MGIVEVPKGPFGPHICQLSAVRAMPADGGWRPKRSCNSRVTWRIRKGPRKAGARRKETHAEDIAL